MRSRNGIILITPFRPPANRRIPPHTDYGTRIPPKGLVRFHEPLRFGETWASLGADPPSSFAGFMNSDFPADPAIQNPLL